MISNPIAFGLHVLPLILADLEGQIWHRQSGHSGAGTCCVSDAGQRRPRSRARDPSPLAAFRLDTFCLDLQTDNCTHTVLEFEPDYRD